MGVVEAPEVIVAASRDEAVSAFGDGSDVTVIAGGTIVMPEITHGRLQPRRALLIGRAGLSGVSTESGAHDDRRHDDDRRPAGRRRAAGHLRARPRRPRDPRPGHARRQPLRAAGRRVARAATCRRRCSSSTRRCAPRAPAASAPSRSRTSSPRAPPGGSSSTSQFADPEAGACATVRRPHAHAYTIMRVCAARVGGELRVAVSGRRARRRAQPRGREALSPAAPTSAAAAERALDDVTPHDDALASSWYRSQDAARARPPRSRRPQLKENDETHGQRHRARRGRAPAHAPCCRSLREELFVTSPKAGCQQGGCGACTVLVDGEPRRSCLLAARRRRGRADHHGRGPRRRPTSSPRSRPPSTSTTPRSAASAPRAS